MVAHVSRILALSFILALAGCASGPTPEQIASIDYGPPVDQEQAESKVKFYFEGVLKDPYSAQYQFGKAQKGYVVGSAFDGRQLYAGYTMDVRVNAKNSYGGYTGYKAYRFVFQSGALIKGFELSPSGLIMPIM
ncbi:hypothetical protein AB1288_07815 [Pseudomonas putida]|uniref:hypothetical protein n=1 Tax=Pseudomonas putida TaxID=303 RepID=UPI00345DDE9C